MDFETYKYTIAIGDAASYHALSRAINVGIDSRLKAIQFEVDEFKDKHGRVVIHIVGTDSLAILMYRLDDLAEKSEAWSVEADDLLRAIAASLGFDDFWFTMYEVGEWPTAFTGNEQIDSSDEGAMGTPINDLAKLGVEFLSKSKEGD